MNQDSNESNQPDVNRVASLALLDSPEAMKLAVVWPYLGDGDRDSDRAWADLAGVSRLAAEKVIPGLRASGICRRDGTTDDLALKFIASRMRNGGKRK